MVDEVGKPMNCQAFRENLFHFQAGELSARENARVEEHLAACACCSERLDLEDRLLRRLRVALPREPAPPDLGARIRTALAATGPVPPAARRIWWKDPRVAAMAAVLLIAVLLVPGLLDERRGEHPFGTGLQEVVITGTIVDYACDREGLSLEQQRGCGDRTHFNALKAGDGTYVHFSLGQPEYAALVHSPGARGRRVTAHGRLYAAIRTLEIENLEEMSGPLPPE